MHIFQRLKLFMVSKKFLWPIQFLKKNCHWPLLYDPIILVCSPPWLFSHDSFWSETFHWDFSLAYWFLISSITSIWIYVNILNFIFMSWIDFLTSLISVFTLFELFDFFFLIRCKMLHILSVRGLTTWCLLVRVL